MRHFGLSASRQAQVHVSFQQNHSIPKQVVLGLRGVSRLLQVGFGGIAGQMSARRHLTDSGPASDQVGQCFHPAVLHRNGSAFAHDLNMHAVNRPRGKDPCDQELPELIFSRICDGEEV
jgi:hypothetical protein